MESVAECAAEYLRTPVKALEDIRDALARFDQTYDSTLEKSGWPEPWDEWRFSQNGQVNLTDMRVCERLKFVFRCVALARTRQPRLFGILDPWEGEPHVVSWISSFMVEANGKETFCVVDYPLQSLDRKLETFEFEILTSNRFVNPSPNNATPLVTDGTAGSKPQGRTPSQVELFTFPEQLPGTVCFETGLPECASESFQQKSTRFGKDVSAIGDELRTLLREIRKSYRHRPAPTETEYAAEDWFAFGCNEWFEPVSSVAPSVLDNLGEWASRFQRAAQVVNVGKAMAGAPLDMELLITLARCLTSNWDRRTGAHLMEVFEKLSEHSTALTQAADAWVYQQLSCGSKPTEERGAHQGIASESEPKGLTQNESIVFEAGAPFNRPTVPICAAEYLKNPALAANDILDALGCFDEALGATAVETDCDQMVVWRFSSKGLYYFAAEVVSDRLKFVARCIAKVNKRKPDLFGILAPEVAETSWSDELKAFLTYASSTVEETFYRDEHPFGKLMESLYDFSDMLEFERLTISMRGEAAVGSSVVPESGETEVVGNEDTVDPKRKLSLNAHMTNLMEKHKESCQSWTVERWQLELTPTWGRTPSKGGIHATAIWKLLMSLRGETQTMLQEKQTAKDQHGKRRSTTY